MSKSISLTQNKIAIVDDEDFEILNRYDWYANKIGKTWYAIRSYQSVNHKKICVLMHRQIMRPPSNMEVDHRDMDGLNNTRNNLRLATYSQNRVNRELRSNNKSGFKGVCWNKSRENWEVTIQINGKHRHIGYYDTPEEAARVYDEAAIKYHGEFARLNFPDMTAGDLKKVFADKE